jgi:hypothetical protein
VGRRNTRVKQYGHRVGGRNSIGRCKLTYYYNYTRQLMQAEHNKEHTKRVLFRTTPSNTARRESAIVRVIPATS